MTNHPFKVGGRYRNDNGEYEVLHIDGERMLIRYGNGREQSVSVVIQARIWQRMLDKAGPPQETYYPGQESQAIQPVIDLVEDVLRTRFRAPYPADITDQVCLSIEDNPDWLARYDNLVLHYSSGGKNGKHIVNNNIGYYTKEITGMVNIGEGKMAESSLIKSYSRLGYQK
jgi:hypothetical protein